VKKEVTIGVSPCRESRGICRFRPRIVTALGPVEIGVQPFPQPGRVERASIARETPDPLRWEGRVPAQAQPASDKRHELFPEIGVIDENADGLARDFGRKLPIPELQVMRPDGGEHHIPIDVSPLPHPLIHTRRCEQQHTQVLVPEQLRAATASQDSLHPGVRLPPIVEKARSHQVRKECHPVGVCVEPKEP
jgi:hypothetical protein